MLAKLRSLSLSSGFLCTKCCHHHHACLPISNQRCQCRLLAQTMPADEPQTRDATPLLPLPELLFFPIAVPLRLTNSTPAISSIPQSASKPACRQAFPFSSEPSAPPLLFLPLFVLRPMAQGAPGDLLAAGQLRSLSPDENNPGQYPELWLCHFRAGAEPRGQPSRSLMRVLGHVGCGSHQATPLIGLQHPTSWLPTRPLPFVQDFFHFHKFCCTG
jgi:hypothetical protein